MRRDTVELTLFDLEVEAMCIRNEYEMADDMYRRIVEKIINKGGESVDDMVDYDHFMHDVSVRTEILKAEIELYKLQEFKKEKSKSILDKIF